ncbi:MAG: translation initiation factor IF-2, partial [Bacteroidota bacterium]
MSESNTPRLMAAAKEFNIGKDTLIEFLVGKGFNRDDIKPTAKLSEDRYRSLQAEFSSDKAAKIKSDQIEIQKGGMAEARKKKEEEEISFRKETTKKTSAKEVEKTEEAPVAEPEEVKQETTPEVVKVEAPEIEGPKVVSKIDLDQVSGKAKGKSKKKEAEPVEEKKPEPVTVAPPAPEKPAEPEQAVIENIKVEVLEGPKILGKIVLPVQTGGSADDREKRKRKRIPIDKKGSQPAIEDKQARHGYGGGGGDRRGPQGGGGRRDQRGGGGARKEDKVIDEKAIQDKLRETQAKLSGGGGKGKSIKSKLRKLKREELAGQEGEGQESNVLQVTEFISASELASLMDVSPTEVVAKCFGLGLMVSINQRLDAEVIELVAGEFGFTVEFIDMEKQLEMEEEEEEDAPEDLTPRAPIVTIMGHVDHGKTSLLDYIRKANVVSGEAGGITQHIGAYEVATATGKKITFLDTPGHEAFTAMRARGAKVTDVAVIVVAADDAVMPQTKEAISHAQAAGVPMIFAVNKIDKDGANPQKIYEQLSQMNILVEEWGGKFQCQEISAKKGLNVDKLLEKILLEAELLDLKANPEREGTGSIIEASLDKGRGYVATVLVQNGTLEQGDLVVSGQYYGRVKAMFNERNQRADAAGPSTPVQILGLNGAPQAGEKFKVYEDESEAKEIAGRRAQILREQGIRTKKHIT